MKIGVGMKRCAKCREAKPLSEFTCDRQKKDGLRSYCKSCDAIYYAAHRKEGITRSRNYFIAHRDEENARRRARRDANIEQERAAVRAYYETHKEEETLYRRRYLAVPANRENKNAKMRLWRARHPNNSWKYDWQKRRALKLGNTVGIIDYEAIKQIEQMICCVCSKKVSEKDLSFDHSIPLSLGGSHSQDNIRIAHLTCNLKRGAGRLPVQLLLSMKGAEIL